MPIYNAQDTLQRTLSSILSQSMSDFELILVDDGSMDKSVEIAKELCASDSRIHLICQQNRGICAARNTGLAAAKGKYITFCDDDDELLPEALSTQLCLAQKTGADMVRTGYRLLRENAQNGYTELPHDAGNACRYEKGQSGAYREFLLNAGPQFVWNALYRYDCVAGISFPEECRNGLEDFVFNARVYTQIKTAVYEPFVGYVHYESQQSTSSCRDADKVMKRIENLPQWVEAERATATYCCEGRELRCVWNDRKAAFVTFLMHQLRDAGIGGEQKRTAWRSLRKALGRYDVPALDICGLKGQNMKQIIALTLYTLHLQDIYRALSKREDIQ